MTNRVNQMKWWGWGDCQVQFDVEDRPKLLPYIQSITQKKAFEQLAPVKLDSIQLHSPNLPSEFITDIKQRLQPDQITCEHHERVIHAYGKSLRDLWRIRRGLIEYAPDCVIYPNSHEDVKQVIMAAQRHHVVVIPFGGGSNIAGCLEPKNTQNRCVVSLDMKRMNQLISIDKQSNVAVIQAGAMGPHLETQLNAHGYTLGHFPDSFEFSSIGGWVATRSAGMKSDKYGKIEDMVIAITMVTPQGELKTISVPKASDGIDIKHLLIGSEGIFGVITQITMQVHPTPECISYVGYVFPNFSSGVAAMQACANNNLIPVMTRLNDPGKTKLSLAFKRKSSRFMQFLSNIITWYIDKIKKIDGEQCCLMLNIFEGNKQDHARIKKKVTKIYRQHGAVYLGHSPGRSFSQAKFDFPYIRDYLLDRGIFGDVSETSTTWSNVLPLYNKVMTNMKQTMKQFRGPDDFTGCHISHTYHTGASLYFTFAAVENKQYGLQHYLAIKKSLEDTFMQNGGTLSHHHAVGYEHLPWIEQDITSQGVGAVTALKKQFDPNGIMNPGKIIPGERVWQEWGWQPTHQPQQQSVSETLEV